MPKRKKMKRETVESGETVPSPPQEAVELAAAEPEVLVQRRPRREVPWALARRWTSEMKRQTKKHERILKAFRKQEAGWDDQRKVFARLDEVSAKAFSKHGGLTRLAMVLWLNIIMRLILGGSRSAILRRRLSKPLRSSLALG